MKRYMPSVMSVRLTRSVKYFWASEAIITTFPRMQMLMQKQSQAYSGSGYAGRETLEMSSQPKTQYHPSTLTKVAIAAPIVTRFWKLGSGKARSLINQTKQEAPCMAR